MPAGPYLAIWLAEIAFTVLAITGLAVRARQICRKRQEAAVACPHANGPGCGCAGCGSGYCPNGVAHCTCFYCVIVCPSPLAHGGSSGGSGGGGSVHFTGGSGGIVSGSSGASGSFSGSSGSYSFGAYSPGMASYKVPARASRAGIAGFDGRAAADFSLAPGRVLGLRQWSVPPPDLSGNPLDTGWHPQYITGATGKHWTAAVFEAVCSSNARHQPPVEADEDGNCGCGCWGYWTPEGMNDWVTRGHLALTGIIEGTGRVLIGEKGFRCQRARIVALTLSSLVRPVVQGPADRLPEAELAEAQDRANAWMAVIDDRIGQLFPDARMFATVKGMLAAFPPGEKFQ